MAHRRRATRIVGWLTGAATGVAMVAVPAVPAHAAFPGRNGRIVFDTVWGFWNGRAEQSQIWSVRPDGTRPRRLTDEPGGVAAWHPAVSPRSLRVTFVLSTPGNNDQVWLMRHDGSQQRLLVDEPDWADTGPSFTADGQRILYSRCGAYVAPFFTCKIVSVNLDGTHRRTIIGGRWHPSDPVMSPDGSRIAYVSDARGVEGRIWVASSHGRHRRPVGPRIGSERVAWSPDGRHLLFTGYQTDRTYTMRANGTHVQAVASQSIFGAWSPDGSRIVSKRIGADQGFGPLRVMTKDGGDAERIVPRSYGAGYSDWGVTP